MLCKMYQSLLKKDKDAPYPPEKEDLPWENTALGT